MNFKVKVRKDQIFSPLYNTRPKVFTKLFISPSRKKKLISIQFIQFQFIQILVGEKID